MKNFLGTNWKIRANDLHKNENVQVVDVIEAQDIMTTEECSGKEEYKLSHS